MRTPDAWLASPNTNEQINGTAHGGLQQACVVAAFTQDQSPHAQVADARAQAMQISAQISRVTIVSPVEQRTYGARDHRTISEP